MRPPRSTSFSSWPIDESEILMGNGHKRILILLLAIFVSMAASRANAQAQNEPRSLPPAPQPRPNQEISTPGTSTTPAPPQPSAGTSVAQPAGNNAAEITRPAPPAPQIVTPQLSLEQTIDRIFQRENQFLQSLRNFHPLIETYVQEVRPDEELGTVPKNDHYFLARLDLQPTLDERSYLKESKGGFRNLFRLAFLEKLTNLFELHYLPLGFAQMVLLDNANFDRQHYEMKYLRREFLGDVRCMVFDVMPTKHSGKGRFLGRIWVEDQEQNIVRFNGTYAPHSRRGYYLHFDSWRLNVRPGLWMPAYIYTEESDLKYSMLQRQARMKGQTRLWGYDLKNAGRQEEFSRITVDSPATVRDQSESAQDATPVESQRAWERMAEDNVLERLEKAGLMAPEGEVDKVLSTVVNNLEITNKLSVQPEVRCRVLLSTPLESLTVGHTIVVSRGLLDVLPDEASLAMVLAHELGHIVLGHRMDTRYAFNDRMLFPDEATFQRVGFRHTSQEEQAADAKAAAFLKNSPYNDKLANAGLFLRAVAQRANELPSLIQPHLGDGLAEKGSRVLRMTELMNSAPQLQMNRVEQVAALPLGARIKMDPWDDHLELIKAKPVALLSAREKMAFEVTPFFPHLSRHGSEPLASNTIR